MAETFEVGDVVTLRSGGTRMTVEQIDGERVSCTWFEGKKLERSTFTAGALKKYVPMQPGVIRGRY